jgi:hypothetical protein
MDYVTTPVSLPHLVLFVNVIQDFYFKIIHVKVCTCMLFSSLRADLLAQSPGQVKLDSDK